MQDRVPLYPGRVTLVPVQGLANTYTMTRADQPTQEGTPLNKASLLQDAVASLFGLTPSTATPNDVFDKLTSAAFVYREGAQIPLYDEVDITPYSAALGGVVTMLETDGALHKYIVIEKGPNLVALLRVEAMGESTYYDSGISSSKWYSGSTLDTYVQTFESTLTSQVRAALVSNSVSVYASGTGTSPRTISRSIYVPSYDELADNGVIEEACISYIPKDKTFWSRDKKKSGYVCYLTNTGTIREENEGTASNESLVYPVICVSSTLTYQLFQDPRTGAYFTEQAYRAGDSWTTDIHGASVGVRVSAGSYTGTGTYGEDNPNSITFPFTPKIWGLYGHTADSNYSTTDIFSSESDGFIMPWGVDVYVGGYPHNNYSAYTYDGNTGSWYSPDNASMQQNSLGVEYYYFAIG